MQSDSTRVIRYKTDSASGQYYFHNRVRIILKSIYECIYIYVYIERERERKVARCTVIGNEI